MTTKSLAAPFRQLIERRLWPVALLLLAALVAVPVVLAEPVQHPASAGTQQAAAGSSGAVEPVVSLADPAARDRLRRVVGTRKDPFAPAVMGKKADAIGLSGPPSPELTGTAGAQIAGVTPGGGGSSTGGSAPAHSSTIAPPTLGPSGPVTPLTPSPPRPTYEVNSLSVRFGESSGAPARRELPRLTGLPGGARPGLLYLGLLSDHTTAIFLVDATASVRGDGDCRPSPRDCQRLQMRRGDIEFVDFGGKQYQLELLTVQTHKTSSASAARAARTRTADGGRGKLRALLSRVGPLRYDEGSGTLQVLRRHNGRTALSNVLTGNG